MTLGMRSDQPRLDAKPKRAPPAHLPNASAQRLVDRAPPSEEPKLARSRLSGPSGR